MSVTAITDDALGELHAELALWPGPWHIEEIHAGGSWGTYAPDGSRREGVGAYRDFEETVWTIRVGEDGWEYERRYFLASAHSIAEASIKLRDYMKERREDPHILHIDDQWIVTGCSDCDRDAREFGVEDEPRPVYV